MSSTCVLSWRIKGQVFRHRLQRETAVLGRVATCDIQIDDDTISRQHAVFRRDGADWTVSDLQSRNGVLVNGRRVETQRIGDGDRITVGTVELISSLTRGSPSGGELEFAEDRDEGNIASSMSMDELAARLSSDTGRHGISSSRKEGTSTQPGSSSALALPLGMPLLDLFSAAAETLLSGLDLDAMLDRVLELVFRSLPKVERGFVCLLGADGELVTRAHRSLSPARGTERVKFSKSITEAAVKNREAVLIEDTNLDDQFGAAESIVSLRIRSVMCAPLAQGDRVAGIVYVDTAIPGQRFNEDDLAVLSTLAMLSAVAVEQARLRDEMERERRLRGELSRSLPPHIVELILRSKGGYEEAMRPREAEISVIFADLVGSTRLAERLTAPEVTALLNGIFERLTAIVFAHLGAVDKYNGDEIVAFFGAPAPQADHAERAVRAALAMQQALAEIDRERGDPEHPLRMRIGVNSGLAVAGGIGHPERRDYTVIGDMVNIAKRLESIVCSPGQVVIGPGTRERLPPEIRCTRLEVVSLKGKETPVEPWRVEPLVS